MAIARHGRDEGHVAAWADTFKAMGDGTRLSILLRLIKGEDCVSGLSKALGMNDPKVSFHLTRLKFAGLVVNERQGQRVIYRINPALQKKTRKGVSFDVDGCLITFRK